MHKGAVSISGSFGAVGGAVHVLYAALDIFAQFHAQTMSFAVLLQKSTRAYCYIEMDEIKSGPLTLEVCCKGCAVLCTTLRDYAFFYLQTTQMCNAWNLCINKIGLGLCSWAHIRFCRLWRGCQRRCIIGERDEEV